MTDFNPAVIGRLKYRARTAASVPVPSINTVAVFLDSTTLRLSQKDATNVVTQIASSESTSIAIAQGYFI